MPVLQSLIADRWVGGREGAALASAIDGATVYHSHADELDFAEALSFARRAGEAALLALDYVNKYEAAYGKGSVSTFGAHAWDAGRLMAVAAAEALKKAKPGTPEFRAALRDALESTREVHGAHGVFNMSPTDHLGLDQRARVMVKIDNGAWHYEP